MRDILVYADKEFKISVPDDSRITFGPWSPPSKEAKYGDAAGMKVGTLRIYKGNSTTDVLALFSGVTGFRDLSVEYNEKVVVEEGSTVWKSDRKGYFREDRVVRDEDWVDPIEVKAIAAPKKSMKIAKAK